MSSSPLKSVRLKGMCEKMGMGVQAFKFLLESSYLFIFCCQCSNCMLFILYISLTLSFSLARASFRVQAAHLSMKGLLVVHLLKGLP